MKIVTQVLALALLFYLASCYRMPAEGEVSTIPSTNNPQLIKKSQQINPVNL